jgi:hypothetical protein
LDDLIVVGGQLSYPTDGVTLEAENAEDSSGTAVFFVSQTGLEDQVLVRTTWQRITKQNNEIIKYKFPANYKMGPIDEGETHGFYAKIGEGIYQGRFAPQGAVGGEDFYDFNKVAIEDIKEYLTIN